MGGIHEGFKEALSAAAPLSVRKAVPGRVPLELV